MATMTVRCKKWDLYQKALASKQIKAFHPTQISAEESKVKNMLNILDVFGVADQQPDSRQNETSPHDTSRYWLCHLPPLNAVNNSPVSFFIPESPGCTNNFSVSKETSGRMYVVFHVDISDVPFVLIARKMVRWSAIVVD